MADSMTRSQLRAMIKEARDGGRDPEKILARLKQRGITVSEDPVSSSGETLAWPFPEMSTDTKNQEAWDNGVIPVSEPELLPIPTLQEGRPKNKLGALSRLASQFETGFRQVPGLPDAGPYEKAVHLAGDIALPTMLGIGLSPMGPVAAAAGAGAGRAIQKGASRAIEALGGQNVKNESPLDVVSDVAMSASMQRLGDAAMVGMNGKGGIKAGYEAGKGAIKEGAEKLLGFTTKAGAAKVGTVIDNFDDAVRLGSEVVTDGHVENLYSASYRKAITPEGAEEPLQNVIKSVADRVGKSASDVSPSEIAARGNEVLNSFGTYKNRMFDLIQKRLRLQDMLDNGVKDPKDLIKLNNEVKSLRETQTGSFTLQDALDGIQAINARLSTKIPKAAAKEAKKEVEMLLTWAEHNGLPNIRTAMKDYNLGSAGRSMSTWLPEINYFSPAGGTEAALRLGAVGAGYRYGGEKGGAAMAILQSPIAMREAIRLGLVGSKAVGSSANVASKAAPVLGQLANKLGRKKDEK
jgi:hypothetical protein